MVTGKIIRELFDSRYYIDDHGAVFSRHREDERYGFRIQEGMGTDGYPDVTLSINGVSKTIDVHRLLAMAFIPNPENKPQVNHKDGNKLNYALDNLEWSTASENMQHAFDNGLCKPPKQPCRVIDMSTGKVYPSIKKAAVDLNISYSNCKKYLRGFVKNKTSLRYDSSDCPKQLSA